MNRLLPWPGATTLPAAWAGLRSQLARCLALAADSSLPATLMLLGEPGFGREALAVELAAGLICRTQPRSACHCPSCERVRKGVHPDLTIADLLPDPGGKPSGVDKAVSLVADLQQRPYEGLRRVVIVDSCHSPNHLSEGAVSALLKTLEEPPPHVHWLLLAANPARVLPTIMSRAVQLRVAPPTPAELLATLAAALGVDHDRADAILASCQGDGGLALEIGDPDLAGTAAGFGETAAAALSGDSLALLRLAAAVKDGRGEVALDQVALQVVALLDLAAHAGDAGAEQALDAATAILGAVQRHEVMGVDVENAVVGSLTEIVKTGK
jgi:DNA polymerase III subunit delta'